MKPVFETLRLIKLNGNSENESDKVRTLKKPLNREVLEYLNEQVDKTVNSKVRTLETLIIPNEKAPEGANSLNGASNGTELENYCVRFAKLSLYEDELIMNIKHWLCA